MARTNHRTAKRFLDLFPGGLKLHLAALYEAWRQTNAPAFFAKAELCGRWAMAFDDRNEMDRCCSLLIQTTLELCTDERCRELCGAEYVWANLLELLHSRLYPGAAPLKLPLKVRRFEEGQQWRITEWRDGNPVIDGPLPPKDIEWLGRYVQWASPVSLGNLPPTGGRTAKLLNKQERSSAKRARALMRANEPISSVGETAQVSDRTIRRWVERLNAEESASVD